MSVQNPFNIYQEQLWSSYHGFPLWNPNPMPVGVYAPIGDVGYINEGTFIRMFNVTLSWDDESNKTPGEPCRYDPLRLDDIAIRRENFGEVDHYSRRVSRKENVDNIQASSPDEATGVTYTCWGPGALLSLPEGGLRSEIIQTKVFQKYIEDNVVSWFNWSKEKGLPVKKREDFVLVYGCTMVASWAAAVFDDTTGMPADAASISLEAQKFDRGGPKFFWRNIRGNAVYHNSKFHPFYEEPLSRNECVFIKGFRAKRTLFGIRVMPGLMRAEDGTKNRQGVQNSRFLNVRKNHGTSSVGLKDVAEESVEDADSEGDLFFAHDDDPQRIESEDLGRYLTSVLEMRERMSDIDSICGNSMRKGSDNLDSQEQGPYLKNLLANASASTIFGNGG